MAKVSVIVPCFNQAQYLDECLQTVLHQSFHDWECIIVNDGSADNTEEVANKWISTDSRFQYLKKINGGLSSARNAGIRIANGEYILPLDADDYIDHTFIHKALTLIESDVNIKGVSSWIQYFGEISGLQTSNTGTVIDLLHCNFTICTTLFRKSAIPSIGLFDESFKDGYEDWEFWIRLLKDGGTINIIPEYLFFYRKKKHSMLVDTLLIHNKVYNQIVHKHIDLYHKYLVQVLELKENDLKKYINQNVELHRKIKNYNKSRYFKIIKFFRDRFKIV